MIKKRKITGIETKNSTLTDEEVAVLDSRGYNPYMAQPFINIMKDTKKDYDDSKTLWENMYTCDKPGCIFRTIWKKLYEDHLSSDMHIYDRRKGLVELKISKLKTRVMEPIED